MLPSNNYRRQSSFNIKAVVLILIICKDLRNWQNVNLNFSFFTVFLKNRNIISKIKRSKVKDYAALKVIEDPEQPNLECLMTFFGKFGSF